MSLGITKGLSSWNSQQNNVERLMDNSAYTAAHPDDTLVLAGPPRYSTVSAAETTGPYSLLPVGALQTFQISASRPTTQLMAIGSGRSFFVSGKAQYTWRVGRLFCNGRNLLRVLHHNMVASSVQLNTFDDVPFGGLGNDTMFYTNLDSELYYIPFGLAALFRSKMKDFIGSIYLELNMIASYTLGFTAGQNMIMEDVNGLCDRVLGIYPTELATASSNRQTVDSVIGFAATDINPPNGVNLYDNF